MPLRATNTEVVLESAGMGPGGTDPDIAVLSNGNLVVTWSEILRTPTDVFDDTDGAIFARVLTPDGVPVSDIIQINTFSPYQQDRPQVVALTNGAFAIGYVSTLSPGDGPEDADTFIRSFSATGQQTGAVSVDLVQDTGSAQPEQILQEIVALDNNRFAVVQQGGGAAVYNTSGSRVPGPVGIVDDMAQLANGNIITASVASTQISLTLYGTQFDTPAGFEGLYGPMSFTLEGGASDGNLEIAALAGGGFAVGWVERAAGVQSKFMVTILNDYGQKVGQTAIRSAFDFDVDGAQPEFDMIGLSDGRMAIAITDPDATPGETGVDILLFDADGSVETRLQASLSDAGSQANPVLTELPDGRIVLGYTDDSDDHNTLRLAYFEVAGASGRFAGSAGDDTLGGLGGHDRLLGLDGNDTIDGRGGNDRLFGGAGDDRLLGGSGNDALRGGDGEDTLIGGAGADGLGGGEGNDRIKGGGGNDIIGGGQGNDRLSGNAGNDLLKGGLGNDVMSGGAGGDTFHFVRNQSGNDRITDFNAAEDILLIDMRGGDPDSVTVTSAGGDTLVSFDTTSVTLTGVVLDDTDITFQFL